MTQKPDYANISLQKHRELKGKVEIGVKVELKTIDDLSIYYTPGIAEVCREIAKDKNKSWEYTSRGNLVAVISDGSAVLGLGNIGPLAGQPVMAGKALLFKTFGGVEAFPIVLDTQDTGEIIRTVKALAPNFAGINLEDISAPRCFEIEDALQDLGIPVMHDDQHGTAVVVLAGLINAVKVVGKSLSDCKLVFNGAGAAGTAVARMIDLYTDGKAEIIIVDSKGIISSERLDLNEAKKELLKFTNPKSVSGDLSKALFKADIFVGVSVPNILNEVLIHEMKSNPIIFALANPIPEIMPDEALAAGAAIIATGRSDFPNQVNNVLAFPGIFRGALDAKATRISKTMLIKAAEALAGCVATPNNKNILPSPLEVDVAKKVAKAVGEQAIKEGIIRK